MKSGRISDILYLDLDLDLPIGDWAKTTIRKGKRGPMERERQWLYVLSGAFLLAGLVFFGVSVPFPLCMVIISGTALLSAGVFMKGKTRGARLCIHIGICLCMGLMGYWLIRKLWLLAKMVLGLEGLSFDLSLTARIVLPVGQEICYVGMCICLILLIHLGWCKFTGTFLAGSYLLLRLTSNYWYLWPLVQLGLSRAGLIFILRETCHFFYCVGMGLLFHCTWPREKKAADGMAGNPRPKNQWNLWLAVSGILYTVLALIGIGASSLLLTNIWLDGTLIFLAACALMDNLFYLFVGLYALFYGREIEKGKNFVILGWILLVMAIVMSIAGSFTTILFVLSGLFRAALAVVYLKGGRKSQMLASENTP